MALSQRGAAACTMSARTTTRTIIEATQIPMYSRDVLDGRDEPEVVDDLR